MQGRQEGRSHSAGASVGSYTSNAVLAGLPRDDFNRLSARLTRVRLAPGEVLMEAGAPIHHVFFLESGLATLLAESDPSAPTQLAMVGREGGLGLLELVTGSPTALATVISQLAGTAMRAPMHEMPRAMHEAPSLSDAGRRSVRALMQQMMETAACNARSTLMQRCARWLVMAHGRLDGDEVPVTHEGLSTMLGVRRSGVTVAMASLQRRALVQTRRSRVLILDPAGLRSFANLAAADVMPESELQAQDTNFTDTVAEGELPRPGF